MIKETIFISHSAPGDNYFAAWLASKLKLLGYKVWVELDELKIGDAFWPEIERVIRNEAIRFVAIISKEYCEKVRTNGTGVFKEISCAERLKDIQGFLCPIRIDDTNPDELPVQLMGVHSIDFYNNWQSGLDDLVSDFQKYGLPKPNESDNQLPFWLDSFKINDVLNDDKEIIYTNWFPFGMPSKIYIHQPLIVREIDALDIYYPYIKESDLHISFFPPSTYPAKIECRKSYEFTVDSFLANKILVVDEFIVIKETRRKIIKLLNHVVQNFFFQRGLVKYSQANTEVYYFHPKDKIKRVSLKGLGRTNVALTGYYKESIWCFGLSAYANIYPEPFFKLNAHIIFINSDDTVPDVEVQHALRQALGSSWYNKKWLDTLLGAMVKLSGFSENNVVEIPVSPAEKIKLSVLPISFETDFGYIEPAVLEDE